MNIDRDNLIALVQAVIVIISVALVALVCYWLGGMLMTQDHKPYNALEHSVVQALITNDTTEAYEATDFHEALLFAIAREIGRVHLSRYQTSWNRWSDDPHIPGIRWHRYVYDCGCPEDGDNFIPRHEEDCPTAQPNFQFENVCFRWYKNPGRGMSVNVVMADSEWRAWFDRCITKIREFEAGTSRFE
jgi:hypothetical protein